MLFRSHPDFGGAHRAWTFGDLVLWADCLVSKQVLKHGMREKLRQYDQAHLVRKDQLDEVFESQALSSLMEAWDGDYRALLNWWRRLVTADFRGRIEFAANVAAAHGPRALTDPPKIVVGTIHSLKGAEADVVYLFPDLSNAGDAQYRRAGAARDSVIRLFYVGATRARETLYICQRATATAVTM